MFFKKIEEWTNKKLKTANIISGFFYLLLVLIIPIIIVCTRYKIFEKSGFKYKLTGVGIVFFVILGIYAYVKLKKVVAKLPQINQQQQRTKFTIEMFLNLTPYFLLIIGFWFLKDDTQLAYKTMLDCVLSLTGATIFEGLIYRYIQNELDIRNKALELNEIEKRRSKL